MLHNKVPNAHEDDMTRYSLRDYIINTAHWDSFTCLHDVVKSLLVFRCLNFAVVGGGL